MSELALKLGSIVTTVLVMVGGYGYAATHLKNPNAPLQPAVEKSILKCMERNPDTRHPTKNVLVRELKAALYV